MPLYTLWLSKALLKVGETRGVRKIVVLCGLRMKLVDPDYRMLAFSDVEREARLVSSAGKGRT